MDCSLPGSSVHGILQARILEWVVISYFRGLYQPRDQTQVSCIAGGFFAIWATREDWTLLVRDIIERSQPREEHEDKWCLEKRGPSNNLICLCFEGQRGTLVAKSCATLYNPMDCRLLCPCDFPGRNTGVGCSFLLQRIFSSPCIKPISPKLSGRYIFTTEPSGNPPKLKLYENVEKVKSPSHSTS